MIKHCSRCQRAITHGLFDGDRFYHESCEEQIALDIQAQLYIMGRNIEKQGMEV